MITIRKIILENFQSHKYSVMEFTDGLNAIVGPTDSGKTAIFRALKWALYNEPQGDYFVREGENNTEVQIHFNNGLILKKYRKKTKNGYELTYPNGEIMEFEGFGNKIPDEIIEATKIRKIQLTPSENRSLNMAEQLDAPFLLSESPALKAAAIGKLVDADVVDYALSEVNLDIRNKKRELSKEKDHIEKLENDLKEYDYLKDLEKTIDKLEETKDIIDEKSNRLNILISLKEKYFPIKTQQETLLNNLDKLKVIPNLEENIRILESKTNNIDNLTKLKENYDKNELGIKKLENILDSLKGIESTDNITEKLSNNLLRLQLLDSNNIKYKEIEKRKDNINSILKNLENLDKGYIIQDKINENITNYNFLFKAKSDLDILTKRIENGENYIKSFEQVEMSKEKLDLISKYSEKLDSLNKLQLRYKNLKGNIDENLKNKEILERELSDITTKYRELLEEVKICPTCYQKIESTEDIIKHLNEEVI